MTAATATGGRNLIPTLALAAITAAGVVVLALVGFAVGRANRTSPTRASVVRIRAERHAFTTARASALSTSRAVGLRRGMHAGLADGAATGKTDGARQAKRAATRSASAPTHQTRGSSSVHQLCPSGQYTTPAGSCVPDPPGFGGTPPVNSPEGQAMINADPTCQNPPPPPGYSGPVQCNNP